MTSFLWQGDYNFR